ncbi:MAG TPA: dihydrofolate reductase, partial [Iamia sp.]
RASEDMAHFKRVTMGHTLVMGRLTWESIGRPLPGRRIVVVSRSMPSDLPATVVTATSPDEGLAVALDTDPDPVVVGGAAIYDALLPLVRRVHRTTIDVDVPDADTWFPDLPPTEWQLASRQPGVDERLTFDVLDRIEPA